MKHRYIIQQQPRLAHIFNQPPIVSYSWKENSLKDILVLAKLLQSRCNHKKIVNKEALSKGLYSIHQHSYSCLVVIRCGKKYLISEVRQAWRAWLRKCLRYDPREFWVGGWAVHLFVAPLKTELE